MFTYNPVPKPPKEEKKKYKGLKRNKPLKAKSSLKAKQPLKQPKPTKRKKPKTKKELKVIRKGLKIPPKSVRNEFSRKEKLKIIEAFGGARCAECGSPYIHFHHAKFRSGSGRGVWRNGVPLCDTHHDLCHESRAYAEKWRKLLRSIYGEYYYMDKWDLWLLGLIEEPTDKLYEEFMLEEERKAREAKRDET